MSRKSNLQRPSISRPSTAARPSISRPSVSRQSAAAQARHSSVGATGRASSVGKGLKVDVKQNSGSNIKYILNYLTENCYPQKLSKKNLLNPTEATFKDVLLFILRDVNPGFEMKKISVDVPGLLTFLGYPYVIKESHFKPVGSPHSWPYVLQALAWLTKFAESAHYESQHVSTLLTYRSQGDEKRQNNELQYLTESSRLYKKFIDGDTNVEQLVVEYKEGCNSEKRCAVLREENAELRRKEEILKQKKNDHPANQEKLEADLLIAKEKLASTKDDAVELENLKIRAEEDIENMKSVVEQQRLRKAELIEKNERLSLQKEVLRNRISKQPSQFDVQKTKQKLINLREERNAAKVEVEEMVAQERRAEVEDSNRQRKFKEDFRQVKGQLDTLVPKHCIRIDGVIDNRTLVQVKSTLAELTNKTKLSKEEFTETEQKLYTDEIKLKELEEDYELLLGNLKSRISQRKYREEDNERIKQKMIRTSSHLDEDIEKTRKRLNELKTELNIGLDESRIDEKLIDVLNEIDNERERGEVLESMAKIKLSELEAKAAQTEYKTQLLKLLIKKIESEI